MSYYIGDVPFGGNDISHFGILGMKWGVRRYQNPDGTLTAEGKARYVKEFAKEASRANRTYYEHKSSKSAQKLRSEVKRNQNVSEAASSYRTLQKATDEARKKVEDDWYRDDNQTRINLCKKEARKDADTYLHDSFLFGRDEKIERQKLYEDFLHGYLYGDLGQNILDNFLATKAGRKAYPDYARKEATSRAAFKQMKSLVKDQIESILGEYGNSKGYYRVNIFNQTYSEPIRELLDHYVTDDLMFAE